MNVSKNVVVAAALWALAMTGHATVIVGGSDLLSAASAQQLTDWLGQGSLRLTNIFDKSGGLNSVDFHNAVDGKGPTMSIIEAIDDRYVSLGPTQLVGGYDPRSWTSSGGQNMTYDDAQRTAFIFNLTTSTVDSQIQGGGVTSPGIFQTNNAPALGPSFGDGADLSVDFGLTSAFGRAYSYGTTGQQNIFGSSFRTDYSVGRLEVFSIALDSGVAMAVPEPQTYALMLAGLGALVGSAAYRKQRNQLQMSKR